MSVCVYCGSRPGREPGDVTGAYSLGAALGAEGWTLIYGGGRVGMMGAVAQGVRDNGGYIVGIIPEGLLAREQGDDQADELIVTTTLRERKSIMEARADAFMALPGGFGTLEELVETMTLRQLAYHQKPIIILNLDGFYDPLLTFFEHAIATGFVHPSHRSVYYVAATVEQAIDECKRQNGKLKLDDV